MTKNDNTTNQTEAAYSYDFDNNPRNHDAGQRFGLTEGQIKYGDYLCQRHTGYNSLAEMSRNYPTLRIDRKGNSKAAKQERTEMQHLRELYAISTGRPAWGHGSLPVFEYSRR